MRSAFRFLISIPGRIMIGLVRFYQKFVSPVIGQNCRFTPTCSCYMIEAIQKYGSIRGGFKGLRRVLRCHPWNAGGHDPP